MSVVLVMLVEIVMMVVRKVMAMMVCGLSLLLVLSLPPRGFSRGTPVFPSPQKPTLLNSNAIWNARTCFNEFSRTPRCVVGKQITNYELQMVMVVIVMVVAIMVQDGSCMWWW